MKRALSLLTVLFLHMSAGLASAASPSGYQPTPDELAAMKAGDTSVIIEVAKKQVSYDLNDPGAAQFRNVTVKEGNEVVCGEVNGKNLHGAYIGFRRFYVLYPAIFPAMAQVDSSDSQRRDELFIKMYEKHCGPLFAAAPMKSRDNALGLTVVEVNQGLLVEKQIRGAVQVRAVAGRAAQAGLQEGDLVLAINNIDVASVPHFDALVQGLDPNKNVAALVRRGAQTRYMIIRP